MAAAVADYRPTEPIEGKRAKTEEAWKIELERDGGRARRARRAGAQRPGARRLRGRGGEAGLDRKRQMLTDKNLDLVVYNDVSVPDIGFDSPDNEVTLLTQRASGSFPAPSKEQIAAGIVDEVERLLEERRGSA